MNEIINFFNLPKNASLMDNGTMVLVLVCLMILCLIVLKYVFKILHSKIAAKTKTLFDDQVISQLERPVYYSVVSLGSVSILSMIGLNDDLIVAKVIMSVFWLVWGQFSIRMSKTVLQHFAKHVPKQKIIRPQTLPMFVNLSLILICLVYFYLILATWGVDIRALIASAGILGLALGFAAKDTLSNFFSGIFILADQPYKMGDFVVLDTGERGEVTHIGIRSTRILTRDDVEVTVPNAIMGNTKIINESGGPYKKFRIRVQVGVAYGTDVTLTRQIMTQVAEQNVDVCQSPEPRVRFRTFGQSSLDFELLCWVDDPVFRGRVVDKLNESIYSDFVANNIEIPYQKQDVYIKEILRN